MTGSMLFSVWNLAVVGREQQAKELFSKKLEYYTHEF